MPTAPDSFLSELDSIRRALPSRSSAELLALSRIRQRRSQLLGAAGGVGSAVAVGLCAVMSLRPSSAFSALKEAVQVSEGQPVAYELMESNSPKTHAETWILPDRTLQRFRSSLCVMFKSGEVKYADDQFPVGAEYAWKPGEVVMQLQPPRLSLLLARPGMKVDSVGPSTAYGVDLEEYQMSSQESGESRQWRLWVDPKSKLILFQDYETRGEAGSVTRSHASFRYPGKGPAMPAAPSFSPGLRFRTEKEVAEDFLRRIRDPDQSQVVGGIRKTLYGVVFSDHRLSGVAVAVITRGGAGQDFTSQYSVRVDGLKSVSLGYPAFLRRQAPPLYGMQPLVARPVVIGGDNYLLDSSRDAVQGRIPSRVTVRVPVWKSDPLHKRRLSDGSTVQGSKFVGYATFTTSKIFFAGGVRPVELPDELLLSGPAP